MDILLMRKLLYIILFFAFPFVLSAQDAQLAKQYFQNGEYEKASTLYEKLYRDNKGNSYYFDRYLDCLVELKDFTNAEKLLDKKVKKSPNDIMLKLQYGKLLEKQFKLEEADAKYQEAIDGLDKDHRSVSRLANQFQSMSKYELAIRTYERAGKILKGNNVFAYNLAKLYHQQGETEKMINSYLDALKQTPSLINSLKSQFSRTFSEEDFKSVQTALYERIQEDEEAYIYPELLGWIFIHKKDYKNALRQARALDRKLSETGARVFKLGNTAARAKDYDVAIEAYEYIVENKGAGSSYYIEAKRESLKCQRKKLVEGFDYTEADLRQLEQKYEAFLNEFGRKKTTATIIAELAELEAFYLNDLDRAIVLLDSMLTYPNVSRQIKAKGKLSLADFYLMKGEIWEATLLYSQVDKEFKDDLLGQEARFKNAKLSYYAADFEWAQAQFDVLKASTSKLIANDALDLSVFIMDNLGLDTTTTAMKMYAESDLLVFQNKFPEAFSKLDSISTIFPSHSLQDDILYTKSNIYYKKRNYTKASRILEEIIEKYPESIRVDNALYKLGEMYEHENQLNDKEKATAFYEKILLEHSGSTFSVEARKRYRKLLGENVQ